MSRVTDALRAAARAVRANALGSLPKEGDHVPFEGETYEVTHVKPFTDRAAERHELTLRRPAGTDTFHVNVMADGSWERVPERSPIQVDAGLASYLYRDPVEKEELKSLILRHALTSVEGGMDVNDNSHALQHLLFAFSDLFGDGEFLKGEAAEKFARQAYLKEGGSEEAFEWSGTMEEIASRGGIPKWLMSALATAQAEDDRALYEMARKRMAASRSRS